jgi:hypothetical protein
MEVVLFLLFMVVLDRTFERVSFKWIRSKAQTVKPRRPMDLPSAFNAHQPGLR